MTVSPLSFDYWHCCNVYKKQLKKSSEHAKNIFSSAFWCDHHLVIATLWILWIPLYSCTFSRTSLLGLLDLEECGAVSVFDFLWLMTENGTRTMKKKLDQLIYGSPDKGEKMTKFSDIIITGGGSSPGHDTTDFEVAICYF